MRFKVTMKSSDDGWIKWEVSSDFKDGERTFVGGNIQRKGECDTFQTGVRAICLAINNARPNLEVCVKEEVE